MVFVTPVVEHCLKREIAQWVHPMKYRSDDPSHHERTLLPRIYISLLINKWSIWLKYVRTCYNVKGNDEYWSSYLEHGGLYIHI